MGSDVSTFAYAGAARGQGYEIWREEFCRRFCQLDAEPSAAARIECTVEVTQVGSLSFGAARRRFFDNLMIDGGGCLLTDRALP